MMTNGKDMSLSAFKELFVSPETVAQYFLKDDLKVCMQAMSGVLKREGFDSRVSVPKYRMVAILSSVVSGCRGDFSEQPTTRKIRKKTPPTLGELCARQTAQKYNKAMLAALYAQCIWTDRKEEWYASSMFKNDCPVGEIGKIDEWFSKPEMGECFFIMLMLATSLPAYEQKYAHLEIQFWRNKHGKTLLLRVKQPLILPLSLTVLTSRMLQRQGVFSTKMWRSVCSKWDTPKKVSSAK